MTPTKPSDRLEALGAACTAAEAEALFDSLPAVRPEELTGRYAGRELATGHPMDGLLEASGWYGKQFDDVDHVHPLLFRSPGGEIFAVEPRKVPLGLIPKVPQAVTDRSRSLVARSSQRSGPRSTGPASARSNIVAWSPPRWSTTTFRSSTCSAGSTPTPCWA